MALGEIALRVEEIFSGLKRLVGVVETLMPRMKSAEARIDELESRCWWCGMGRKACKCREWVDRVAKLEGDVELRLGVNQLIELWAAIRELQTFKRKHDEDVTLRNHHEPAEEYTHPDKGFAPVVALVRAARATRDDLTDRAMDGPLNPGQLNCLRLLNAALQHFEALK